MLAKVGIQASHGDEIDANVAVGSVQYKNHFNLQCTYCSCRIKVEKDSILHPVSLLLDVPASKRQSKWRDMSAERRRRGPGVNEEKGRGG